MNLWWPAEVGRDIAPDECAYDAEASELSALVFVGNLVLVVGILLGVFLLHILVVSGVEALWLTKVREPCYRVRGGCLTLVHIYVLPLRSGLGRVGSPPPRGWPHAYYLTPVEVES